jgi:DNA replication protein
VKKFPGFPDRMQYTPIPNVFFSAVLSDVDDLVELKVTMHLFRLLYEKRGFPKLVQLSDLYKDRALLLALRAHGMEQPEQILLAGLKRATERGTFVSAPLLANESEDRCYLLNTALNRGLIQRAERGELALAEGTVPRPGWVALPEQRPSIFDLYEQNVGLITPLIAEELQQAEEAYPADWIEEAFREAVSYNKRNWRYVRRILENWATEGRGEDGTAKRRTKGSGSPSKYLGGKYAHLLNS